MMAREPLRSRKSYMPWLVSRWLLQLNPRVWEEHLTSQLSQAAAWLLVTYRSSVYPLVDELRPCVLWPLMIGQMVVLLTFFDMVSMVLLIGSWCYYREWVWNLQIKLCCTASGKWNVSRVALQGFDTGYIML